MLISFSVLISKQLHSRFMTLFSLLAFVFMESNMSENENSKLPEVAIRNSDTKTQRVDEI